MTPREQIIKMQRIILRQLKESVSQLQGPETKELAQYHASYQREFNRASRVSTKRDLVKAILKSDIVFGADFHPFLQSQKTHLRLLREVVKLQRPIILALESVSSKYQEIVEQYCEGKIKDKIFLEKINYFKEWGFPWENYKILFEFAIKNKIKIYGINHHFEKNKKRDLLLRDTLSAKKISELRALHPKSLIYVLYGDLHLASSRLPRLTKKFLRDKIETKSLTIFQNSEKLYWRLASRKLEEKVDVLKLRSDTFCVVNSPPWMKWQAYLHFLEKRTEQEDVSDPGDQIKHFSNLLADVLEVKQYPQLKKIDHFNFFEKGDVGLTKCINQHTTAKEKKMIEKLIRLEKSFFISRINVFYLVRTDVNQIAALCGKYIHSKMRRESNMLWSLPQDFSSLVWIEAMSFFMSKIINNRRKQQSVKELSPQHQVTLIVLEQRLQEKVALYKNTKIQKIKTHRARKTSHYIEASRLLGGILGQKIYDAFIQGRIDLPRLRSWMRVKVFGNNQFPQFYLNALKEISRLNLSQVKLEERL